ncbi:MAG TPA: dihydrodipicolinate synthase family protein [Anaeromyxobacteraceae bacterium]|nr:dihydrodipicolinate synthase family protein [Anaeromyxobacteraceae bacterium]
MTPEPSTRDRSPAPPRLGGVLAPVLTPFRADLEPDVDRLVRHCRWLLSQGCAGLAPFGTTSEANSLSAGERQSLLERLLEGGLDAARLVPGTGCCALTETVGLTRHAVRAGCAGALLLPPFYYKQVSEDGLFRSFAEVIERVGDARLRLYLYHIPPVAQVPIGVGLVERLLRAYPETVAGIKDSSGDFANTQALLALSGSGLDVFVGSERFLLANMRGGGAGCITATGNVNPAAIARLHREWRSAGAEALQAGLDALRGLVERFPVIAALKEILAHHGADPAWRTVRPPLTSLTQPQAGELLAGLSRLGFAMPGLPAPPPGG